MTNLNAQRIGAKGANRGQWKPITMDEMKALFGLNIAMGIAKIPAAKMYWQKKWLLAVPSFGPVMSRNRFLQFYNTSMSRMTPIL